MDAEIAAAAVAQQLQHDVRDLADAGLDGGAVEHEFGDMAGDRALLRGGGGAGQIDAGEGVVGFEDGVSPG